MDSDAASLCLEDIRSVRMGVNEILRILRTGRYPTMGTSPPSPRSLVSDSSSVTNSDDNDRWNTILKLLLNWNKTSCIAPIMPGSREETTTPGITLLHQDPLLTPVANATLPLDLLMTRCPEPANRPSEVLAILSITSLAAWLVVVILTLLWMRLTDLKYKPSVVS